MSNFNEFDRPLAPEQSIGSVLSHAWENYKEVVGYGILIMVGTSLASTLVSNIIQFLMGIEANDAELMKEVMASKNYFLIFQSPAFVSNSSISYMIGLLFYPLYAGYLYVIHKANSKKSISFNDLFIGYHQNTLQIILYGLLSGLLTGIGLLLCFIPGVLLGALLFIGLPVVFFENKTALEGIRKSFEVGKKHLGAFLGIALLASVISLSGILLCCIGIIATAPFIFSAFYAAYCAYCGAPYEVENT